ncbi:hypothetical protein PHJA_001166200 [Phtheirospermum japonicum]|uniref:Uncharacterized protein n=1 Tax=Phtheirospermum japonicum TaxID=374723 RepID=A0A830C249_9LAMI|nr:hypothetical protein PHJA_001166200 [Phtheirospermum japonicum]
MAALSPNQSEFEVPEGWMMVTKPSNKGKLVKDFVPPTTGPFAMRKKPKIETASSSNPKHATKSNVRRGGSTSKNKNQKEVDEGHDAQRLVDEVQTSDEIQCARALLEISGQRPFAMRSKPKIETASSSNPKHSMKSNNQKEVDEGHDAQRLVDEVQTEDEIQCARALLEISGQSKLAKHNIFLV